MFSYFENRKITYFDVFCLNFSIETKIKTLFLISCFNLSKTTRHGTLGTWIFIVWKLGLEVSEIFAKKTHRRCFAG